MTVAVAAEVVLGVVIVALGLVGVNLAAVEVGKLEPAVSWRS